MSIMLKEPFLVQKIERVAVESHRPPEQVLEEAVRAYLARSEQEIIHAETEAFWSQHDQLVAAYAGQYVALYQGQVVDHDQDVAALESRARERFGSLPVLIAPVQAGPRRDLYWRGGRIEGKKP